MKRDGVYPRSYCLIIALFYGVINYDIVSIILYKHSGPYGKMIITLFNVKKYLNY